MICHYWYFTHRFKFRESGCNGCHDLLMITLDINDTAIITVKGDYYVCMIYDVSYLLQFII